MASNTTSFHREEFEQMIRDGEFLEHANVHGNYYGTARRFLQESGEKRP